jgi:glycerophosphoryl diester phosphodiesterase
MSARRPIVIGHRGASGYLPEHTLPAYALAILQGADYIEPDLVATRDGLLVARHENEIGGTTDVAAHPEFADRRRAQRIDGTEVEGWFTEDFTLAELKTLRARERIPLLRPGNVAHDGKLEIPSFDEILAALAEVNASRRVAGQPPVGVYPETKHPTHFESIGLPLEQPVLDALQKGLGDAPAFIQSFEVENLRWLHAHCAYPLVQLMAEEGGPLDYAPMCTPAGLQRVAEYASTIGVQKSMVMRESADGSLAATSLVRDAHAAGLAVHVWTFRAENHFLPHAMRSGENPAAHGDLAAEVRAFVAAGVDGLFCDQPDVAVGMRAAAATR